MVFKDKLKIDLITAYENMLKEKPSATPTDICIDIIVKVYLPNIGLGDKCRYQYNQSLSNRNERTNVVVSKNEKNVYYVECHPNRDISNSEIKESITTMRSLGIKYGVVTNGLIYILVSSGIEPPLGKEPVGDEYIIFKFCLKDNKSKLFTKHHLLEYLHSKYILEPFVMDNFEYIARYKVFHREANNKYWHVYECTLLNFFNYFSITKKKKILLDDLTTDDFIDFIRWQTSNSKKENKETTLSAKYTHISALLTAFNNKGLAHNRNFEKSRKDVISKFNAATYEADRTFLNTSDVKTIIDFLKSNDRDNRERNIAMFGMCVYFCAERRTIVNLKWDAIASKSKEIVLYGRTIKLPLLMTQCFEEMKRNKKNKKIDSDYVFTRRYRSHYDRFSDTYINQLFETFEKISDEQKWQKYKPQMIRNAVIYELHQAGAYLDEIMCFADISSKNIHNYISDDEIIKKRMSDIFSGRSEFVHPFESVFSKSLKSK